MEEDSEECMKLLRFQIDVHWAVLRAFRSDRMLQVFLSYQGDGSLQCLVSYLYWIKKRDSEGSAFELAAALLDVGVKRDCLELVTQSVDTYLRRKDADLRVVSFFEQKAAYLRTFVGQFMIRYAILETHGLHLESHSSEVDKLIACLAETYKIPSMKMAQLSRLKLSPRPAKLNSSLATSNKSAVSLLKDEWEMHDGTRSE